MRRLTLSIILLAGLGGGALAEERSSQQATSPPAEGQQASPAPIRKDPAEITGAVTPRKVGQESERIIDGQRCSDVLDQPSAFPHPLWVRCRAH